MTLRAIKGWNGCLYFITKPWEFLHPLVDYFCNYHYVWLWCQTKRMQSIGKNTTDRQSSYEYAQFLSRALSSCTAIIFYCDATREDSYERGFSDQVLLVECWVLRSENELSAFRSKTHNWARLRIYANIVKETCWRRQTLKIKTRAEVYVRNFPTVQNPLYDLFHIFQFKLKSFVFFLLTNCDWINQCDVFIGQ